MSHMSTIPDTTSTSHHSAATFVLWSTTAAAVLIFALHVLEPEYAPLGRMLSEYANGAYGWVMKLVFWLLALSNFALAVSVWSRANSVLSKLGVAFLVLAGCALIGAGLFDMDPITAKPEDMTAHGFWHGIVAMVGIPSQALAAMLLAFGMTQAGQAFDFARSPLRIAALLVLAATAVMFVYVPMTMTEHGIGPLAGLFNRVIVATWIYWFIRTAWAARPYRPLK